MKKLITFFKPFLEMKMSFVKNFLLYYSHHIQNQIFENYYLSLSQNFYISKKQL